MSICDCIIQPEAKAGSARQMKMAGLDYLSATD
jgi:hypothetical protein